MGDSLPTPLPGPNRSELASLRCSCGLEIRELQRRINCYEIAVCAHGHRSRVGFDLDARPPFDASQIRLERIA